MMVVMLLNIVHCQLEVLIVLVMMDIMKMVSHCVLNVRHFV